MYGIDNIKKAMALLIEGGNIAGEIVEMKGVKWYQKIGPIVNIVDEAVDLFKVDWKAIPVEIKDLSAEEKAELHAFFVEKFNISQEEVESVVEKCFALLITTANVVMEIVALVKTLKK